MTHVTVSLGGLLGIGVPGLEPVRAWSCCRHCAAACCSPAQPRRHRRRRCAGLWPHLSLWPSDLLGLLGAVQVGSAGRKLSDVEYEQPDWLDYAASR